MTYADLEAWRKQMRWQQYVACEELGISSRTWRRYEKTAQSKPNTPIPRTVQLACAALKAGIRLEYQTGRNPAASQRT
jgi:transcriptional regulator with XRE-family HTH domain